MYTLADIVNEYLVETGNGQSNMASRLYQFGVNFLRKKHFDTTGFPQVAELTISANDTAPLPAGYINWIKIGVAVGGEIFCMGENNNLSLVKRYDNCGNPERPLSSPGFNNLGLYPGSLGLLRNPLIADNYVNGEFVGRMFGIGGEGNCFGEFRIDKTYNQIQFSALSRRGCVVIEFLKDITFCSDTDDYEVHPFAIEATKKYIRWQYKVNADKPLGEQREAERLFKNEHKVMKMRFANKPIAIWAAAFRSGDMLAPKM